MTAPACQSCRRVLAVGESAWADEVKVIEAGGVRLETRYTCEDCEARP